MGGVGVPLWWEGLPLCSRWCTLFYFMQSAGYPTLYTIITIIKDGATGLLQSFPSFDLPSTEGVVALSKSTHTSSPIQSTVQTTLECIPIDCL